MAIHMILAELWTKQQRTPLTEYELIEMDQCLQFNASIAYKLADLFNLATAANMTNDTEYIDEIYAAIEKLEHQYQLKKPTAQDR